MLKWVWSNSDLCQSDRTIDLINYTNNPCISLFSPEHGHDDHLLQEEGGEGDAAQQRYKSGGVQHGGAALPILVREGPSQPRALPPEDYWHATRASTLRDWDLSHTDSVQNVKTNIVHSSVDVFPAIPCLAQFSRFSYESWNDKTIDIV